MVRRVAEEVLEDRGEQRSPSSALIDEVIGARAVLRDVRDSLREALAKIDEVLG